MTGNFLKQNESKTEVIKILSNRDVEFKIISNIQIDDSCSLSMPNDLVKTPGVTFDDRLKLEKHINRAVSTYYANLLNLGSNPHEVISTYCANLLNLGSLPKLTKTLKLQLVYFLILSYIDYCNTLFYYLPEYLLHKLTKVCMLQ